MFDYLFLFLIKIFFISSLTLLMMMILFFCVILFFIDINEIDSKYQPCEQTFGSNHYDLNQLSHLTIKGQETLFTYAFTPCGLVSTDQCGPPSSTPFEPGMTACQQRFKGPGSPTFESSMGFLDGYGKSPSFQFTENTDGPGTGVIMVMKNGICNGGERLVTVTFTCDKSILNPTSMEVVEFPICVFQIRIRAAEACPVAPTPTSTPGGGTTTGGSTVGGVVFIIILVVVIALYLSSGIAYNKFRENETGLKLLPHRSFWLSLPGLFVEGCRFSFIFIRTCGKPSTNSYNSL